QSIATFRGEEGKTFFAVGAVAGASGPRERVVVHTPGRVRVWDPLKGTVEGDAATPLDGAEPFLSPDGRTMLCIAWKGETRAVAAGRVGVQSRARRRVMGVNAGRWSLPVKSGVPVGGGAEVLGFDESALVLVDVESGRAVMRAARAASFRPELAASADGRWAA